jgi:Fur family peroxide stress response transcriptional regulator
MSKDTVLDKMKEEGLRLTPQRIQIVELLFELSHPTADRIYSMMTEKFPYVSQATVYNTLKKLKEIGIVKELTNGDKSSNFEVSETEHWHFTCKLCGDIHDLEPNETDALMAVGTHNGLFQVDSCQVEFYGVCGKCRD